MVEYSVHASRQASEQAGRQAGEQVGHGEDMVWYAKQAKKLTPTSRHETATNRIILGVSMAAGVE